MPGQLRNQEGEFAPEERNRAFNMSIFDINFPDDPPMPVLIKLLRKAMVAIWRNARVIQQQQQLANSRELYEVRNGANVITHGLGQRPAGWIVEAIIGDRTTSFYVTQDDWDLRDDLNLTLQSSAATSVILRFFA